jgi:hypothetical protein
MSHLPARLFYAAVALFVLIQLIPVRGINGSAFPEEVAADTINWDSLETQQLAQDACFDCHSYQTELPWYGRVAPVSWVVAGHVREGREELNFSTWQPDTARGRNTNLTNHETTPDNETNENERDEGDEDEDHEYNNLEGREDILEEIREVIYENEMPPRYYMLMHPRARLSEAEKDRLARGLVASLSH